VLRFSWLSFLGRHEMDRDSRISPDFDNDGDAALSDMD
jgi:hypothetical protein